MIHSVDKNDVLFTNQDDKTQILNQLKTGLDNLGISPKIKLNSLNLVVANDENKSLDDLFFGKGRKHYQQHPNFIDNVKFDYKDYYTSPNERFDELVNYYSKVGEQERNYNFSPQMHSFYKKKKLDPIQRYSKKVRHVDLSPENPHTKSKEQTNYYVMKFNQVNTEPTGFDTSSNVIGGLKETSDIKLINKVRTKIVRGGVLKNVYKDSLKILKAK